MTEPFVSVTVGVTPDEVWRALRDPEQIGRWFGWEHPGLEDEIALIFHGVLPEDTEPPPDLHTANEVDDDARTLRTGPHLVEVIEVPGGTEVRMTRVIDVSQEGWEVFHAEIDHIEEGWVTFLQQLAFALARHPGDERRTIFGTGALEGDALAVLGLGAVPPAGEAYTAAPGPGDALTGTVWFRTADQVGLTVDQWGDGLLIAAAVPGGPSAMTIGSTYGLPDDELAALRERWATWWAATATTPPTEPAEG